MSLSNEGVSAARASNERVRKVVEAALEHGRELTGKGRDIDQHQVHSERLAYLATEALAAETLVTYAEGAAQQDPFATECATIFAAQVAARARP
jgi:alkylation response protein AidB-like acyl-CoA dehydrogenase